MSKKNPKELQDMPVTFDDSFHHEGTNIRTPYGLKRQVDHLLKIIHDATGVKYSRNMFILKSIRYYVDHLMTLPNIDTVLKNMEGVTFNQNTEESRQEVDKVYGEQEK